MIPMALRQLRLEGDEILKKKAKPVKEITPNIISLLDDMLETLHAKNGVGIAAPQVGVLRRIAVIEVEDEIFELINPEIINTEGTQVSNEACLSVMGRCGDVKRPLEVTVQALNREGEQFAVTVDEFLATVFCHEIDHLDGILYLDKATNIRDITPEELQERKEKRQKKE